MQADRWTGRRLGAYELQERIGAGGMGVVYRALDTKLNRLVALKLVADAEFSSEARRRFRREAEAASSLNHPHIVTVHDAGEIEGRDYLVTELIDGGTLRDWMLAAPRSWQETVELLIGVADGLAAAHEAGILHRDVKPQNILIMKSGYAKLADFGLAKLRDAAAADDASTVTDLRTSAGAIIGTPAYMAPEQVAGHSVDARSDVFAFGIVLYEILARKRPFGAASGIDLLHAVMHNAPDPLPETAPPQLCAIVEKALEKDPADRYQSMREMVVDLRRVARGSADATTARAPGIPVLRKRAAWLMAALALAVLVALALLIVPRLARPPAPPARAEYVQLTNFADSATSPAVSPDGRMLAFIRGEGTIFGAGEIWVKLLPDGEPVQITHDGVNKQNLKFSADGARLAYTIFAPDGKLLDTWAVPVLGGQPRLLLSNASGLTWTPTGVLFSEFTGRGNQMSIASSSESRADARPVYVPPGGENGMAHHSYLSPDRKQLLVAEMVNEWLPCRLAPAGGGSPGRVVGPAPSQCTDAAWSPDGKWMYFNADAGGGTHIWRQRFPDGTPEHVTFGVTQEEGVEFLPDGKSFVTAIGTSQSTIWVHDSRGDRQMSSEGYAFLPSISPDGRKLYYLVRSGSTRNFMSGGLWSADLETGQRQRLLPDFQLRGYTISPDGQRVAFVASDETGRTPVWVAPTNGRSAPRRLTMLDGFTAHFVGDHEIVLDAMEQGTAYIYRVNDDGTELHRLLPTPNLALFAVSPDGRWLAAETPTQFGDTLAYPADGGRPTLICGNCSMPQGTDIVPSRLSWTADGRFVYVKYAASTYAIPLKTGQMLPRVPPNGFPSKEAIAAVPGARLVSNDPTVYPGPNPSIYAFAKVTTQRNIYRVPVP